MVLTRRRPTVRQQLKESLKRPSQRGQQKGIIKKAMGNTKKADIPSQINSEQPQINTLEQQWDTPIEQITRRTDAAPTNEDFTSAVKGMEISGHQIFELTKRECRRKRSLLYSLNKENNTQYYTRYIDDKYLMVWRMK